MPKWGDCAISPINVRKLLNGESRTMPARPWSRSACINAVTAPMERPQRPIAHTCGTLLRKCSITTFKSSRSYHPRDTYSPSLKPLPAKSKQTTAIFLGNKNGITHCASGRPDALPCKYITTGNCGGAGAPPRYIGLYREHTSLSPRSFRNVKSSRCPTQARPTLNSVLPSSERVYRRRGGRIIKFQSDKTEDELDASIGSAVSPAPAAAALALPDAPPDCSFVFCWPDSLLVWALLLAAAALRDFRLPNMAQIYQQASNQSYNFKSPTPIQMQAPLGPPSTRLSNLKVLETKLCQLSNWKNTIILYFF